MLQRSPIEEHSSGRNARIARACALVVATFVSWPLIALLHEILVASMAILLSEVFSSDAARWLSQMSGIDQVYASVMMQMAGDIQVRGVSVAGPAGAMLHQLAPYVFSSPDLVPAGAWTGAVIDAGSSMLGRLGAQVGAASALIVVGLTVCVYVAGEAGRKMQREGGWGALTHLPYRLAALGLIGMMMLLRAIGAILSFPLTMGQLEAMGLAQFSTKLLPSTQQSYSSFIDKITPSVPSFGPVFLLLATFWLSVAMIVFLRLLVWVIGRPFACWPPAVSYKPGGLGTSQVVRIRRRTAIKGRALASSHLYPALAALVAVAFVADVAGAKTNFDYQPGPVAYDPGPVAAMASEFSESYVSPAAKPSHLKVSLKPSVVTIAVVDHGYQYLVNGVPRHIRGVGYNAQYGNLTPVERMKRYSNDFSAIRAAGFNTILGWDQNNFDGVTLAEAANYDIGVVLPYRLPKDVNYTDPTICQGLKREVLAWVAKYKNQPALRMWGIGNEVLHALKPKQDKAFATFYYDLAVAVHELDPNHPVLYRDAEDVYIPIIKEAFKKNNAPQPWFVYGTNIFTYRLNQILANWPKHGLHMPLLASEFAPTGLTRNDRPAGYMKMWEMLRDDPSEVIGGFMYVWSTAGPEPLDRVYGLVNQDGVPTDGSLQAMSAEFHAEERGGGL